ncbi:MAG TPA: hypothetical protein VM733_04525 [Thermoanaerobaculia bacterium]|nr:hypothetical protein [Thermoanaerobaculia bacterium]
MRALRLTVALILASAAFAASSPEAAIGGSELAPAPYGRWYSAAASNGTDFFAVWTDYRASAFESVIGTRITAQGEILDPTGILLGTGSSVEAPQVVWDGSAYVIAWSQVVYSYAAGRHPARLWMTRVAADGRIVTPARVIKDAAMSGKSGFLASNGNVTVIAYVSEDPRSQNAVKALVLDRNGNVIYDQTLLAGNGPREDVNVATSGSDFVFAWTTYIGSDPYIEAASLDANGERLAQFPRLIGDGISPTIASNGDQYVIVARRTIGEPVWVSRVVSAELAAVSPTCQVAQGPLLNDANVVFRNGQYDFIAWRPDATPEDTLVTARLDLAGCAADVLRDLTKITTEVAYAMPAVATNGREVLTTWTHSHRGEDRYDIAARVFRGSQLVAVTQPLLLARSANAQRDVQIADGGGTTLAVWREADNSTWMTRLGAGGRGTRLSTLAVYTAPRVAFDGTRFVVAWADWRTINLRWVDPASGNVVASQTIVEENTGPLALAATGDGAYAAWIDIEWRVRLARVTTGGASDVITVSEAEESFLNGNPALSWNGSALLVAWTEDLYLNFDPPSTIPQRVFAARVTPSLNVIDTAPLLVGDEPKIAAGTPVIASNGNDWLVAWDGGGAGVRARRVSSNGTLEGNDATLLTRGFAPSLAFDGVRYALTWQDLPAESNDYRQRGLRLGTVSASGPLGASFGQQIALLDNWPSPASIARAGNGRVVIAYNRVSFTPEHGGVERAFARFFDTTREGKRRATD